MSEIVATIEGLARFEGETATIHIGPGITALVGPNGAGKSTLLEALAEALVFFSCYRLRGPLDKVRERIQSVRSAQPQWTSCALIVPLPNDLDIPLWFAERLGTVSRPESVKITVVRRASEIVLSALENEVGSINLDLEAMDFVVDSLRVPELQREQASLATELGKLQTVAREALAKLQAANSSGDRHLTNRLGPPHEEAQREVERFTAIKSQRDAEIQAEIKHSKGSDIRMCDGSQVSKTSLESFIEAIVPDAFYVHGDAQVESYLASLVKEFREARNAPGADRDGSPYKRLQADIEGFLGTDVDVAGEGESFRLVVSGRTVEQVSRGTHLALCFFAIGRHVSSRGIVLWDEPENGMHATRRNKMRDLMLQNSRRFVVATHQTEFCPVLDEGSRVFKLLSLYRREHQTTTCRLRRVKDLAGAFAVLESLGLEPSRILFTANVIIWVEGPSDAVYLRFWLKQWARRNGKEFVEGFDYTILFTGGANLAHHTLTHEFTTDVDSLVNVLTVSPASIFFSDSDLSPKRVLERLAKISEADWPISIAGLAYERFQLADELEKETAVVKSLNAMGGDHSSARLLLKPRVVSVLDAADRVNQAGGLATVILTHGRETENYLGEVALRQACRVIYEIGADDHRELDILNSVAFGRWDGFLDQLREKVEVHSGTKLHQPAAPGKMARVGELQRKVALAMAHVEASGDDFDVGTLRDGGRDVERVAKKVLEARDRYRL